MLYLESMKEMDGWSVHVGIISRLYGKDKRFFTAPFRTYLLTLCPWYLRYLPLVALTSFTQGNGCLLQNSCRRWHDATLKESSLH